MYVLLNIIKISLHIFLNSSMAQLKCAEILIFSSFKHTSKRIKYKLRKNHDKWKKKIIEFKF